MFTVYVLRSLKNGKRYVGFTSKELFQRLKWHDWGLTAWTRQNGPFEAIHSETFRQKDKAQRRERFFKTGNGRKTLDIILAKDSGSASATQRGEPATVCGGGSIPLAPRFVLDIGQGSNNN